VAAASGAALRAYLSAKNDKPVTSATSAFVHQQGPHDYDQRRQVHRTHMLQPQSLDGSHGHQLHSPAQGRIAPDRSNALRQYRERAAIYDLELALLEPVRMRAIARLALSRGATVLDVGCGTGLSFPLIERRIGPAGAIVGIEQSPEMIERARARIAREGWRNIQLVNAPVEDAGIAVAADAALFHFTHDIMRTPRALANIVDRLKPGARVVASGLKWAPVFALPVNVAVTLAALRSTSTIEGLGRPWSHLERLVPDLEVEQLLGGGVYLASGTIRAPARG
jgi:SAM-dependent methyltransferase